FLCISPEKLPDGRQGPAMVTGRTCSARSAGPAHVTTCSSANRQHPARPACVQRAHSVPSSTPVLPVGASRAQQQASTPSQPRIMHSSTPVRPVGSSRAQQLVGAPSRPRVMPNSTPVRPVGLGRTQQHP
ncbi:Unknown protein, partial [Striga hermonthica]